MQEDGTSPQRKESGLQQVGRYKVLRRIGAGGMAEVVEAIAVSDGGFQRKVAIKRMLAVHEDNAEFARMFVDEANIASQLHHANIASVLDFGIIDGLPFQVLEYVDGADAHKLYNLGVTAGRPIPPELALHICTEVAHALSCAHTARDAAGDPLCIVHRDVGPGNILISWNGDVKLTDFGIAFSKGRRAERTIAGMTKGTPPYMSPEQMMGGDIDLRTDIFALGCVLHFLLTGRSPLAIEPNVVNLLSGAAMTFDPLLPEDVRGIVARATRYAKNDRFESASAMAAAVGATLHRRINRDAKTLMLEWLASVRPTKPVAEKRGKLDGLLLFPDIVLSNANKTVREFEGAKTTLADDELPTAADLPIELPVSTVAGVPKKLGTPHVAAIAAGTALLLGIGTLVAVRGLYPSAPAVPASASASATTASTPPPVPMPPQIPVPPMETATVTQAPTTSAPLPAPPVVAIRVSPSHDASVSKYAKPDASATAAPAPEPEVGTGVFLVAGTDAVGAAIFIDEKNYGFAPLTLDLPAGQHSVKLVGPGGRVIATKSVHVTARHTRSTPLRWIVE